MPDLTSFWISIRVATMSTIIVMILGILVSKWLYHRKKRWVKIVESFILLPIVLPPTVMGFIHLPVVFTLTGAVIASVIVSFPLMYQHTIQGFNSIDKRMLDTARTMGASESKIFYRIVLPLSKRYILSGIVMSFARAIGEFGATLMVAGYIPNKTNTLPLEIYFLVVEGKENQAWLWVLVLVAFSIVVIMTINLMNYDKFRERD